MKCPGCLRKTRVIRTSPAAPIVRHRRCDSCNLNFRTVESVVLPHGLKVFKAGNRGSEPYDRRKLARTLSWLNGSHRISERERESILLEVEYNLLLLVNAEIVSTATLAELLFKSLNRRHPDAARRFATRYRDGDGRLRFDRALRRLSGFDEPGSSSASQLELFASGARSENRRGGDAQTVHFQDDEAGFTH